MTVPAESHDGAGPTTVGVDVLDGVLEGRIRPSDLPAAYRGLAHLLRALRSPATKDELSREPIAVATAVVALERSRVVAHRSRSLLAKARLAVLVAAGTSVAATGAAAANVLPQPLERPVLHALSRVGIVVTPPEDGTGDAVEGMLQDATHGSTVPTAPSPVEPPATGVPAAPSTPDAAGDGRDDAGTHPMHRRHDPPKAAHRHGPPHERLPAGHGPPVHANDGGTGPPGHANAHGRADAGGRPASEGDGKKSR